MKEMREKVGGKMEEVDDQGTDECKGSDPERDLNVLKQRLMLNILL